jgi:hypothetical protein
MDRTTEIDVLAIVLTGAAVLLPFLGQTHDVSSPENLPEPAPVTIAVRPSQSFVIAGLPPSAISY